MNSSLRRLVDELVDLVLPRRCVVCGRAGSWLCGRCAGGLVPQDEPLCRRCGAAARRPVVSCPECVGRDLAFLSARAAYRYDGPARCLVTACKFRSLRSLGAEMARLAQDRFDELVASLGGPAAVAFVTAVPVHRERRLERGFDQGELLARELAAAAGLPFAGVLARTRQGSRQSGLAAAARAANVAEAYCLDRRRAERAAAAPASALQPGGHESRDGAAQRGGKDRREGGKLETVVIVDDVYTTGETLNQCSLELRSAGWSPHAFTFARAARSLRSQGRASERLSKERSR